MGAALCGLVSAKLQQTALLASSGRGEAAVSGALAGDGEGKVGTKGWGWREGRWRPGRAPVVARPPVPTGMGTQRRAVGLRPVPPGHAHAHWAGRTRTAAAPCLRCPGGSGYGGRSRLCRGRGGLPGRLTGPRAAPVGKRGRGQPRAAPTHKTTGRPLDLPGYWGVVMGEGRASLLCLPKQVAAPL